MSDPTPTDRTNALARGLKGALDTHGFSFHYSVLRKIHEVVERLQSVRSGSSWQFEVSELPVDVKGTGTRIDFVLRGGSSDSNCDLFLIAECKRANPALKDWCFVRAPYVRRNQRSRVLFDLVGLPKPDIETTPIALTEREGPYQLGLEVKGAAAGDARGTGRGTIEEAAGQVLRGTNGFVEFLKSNPQLIQRPAVLVPAILTTALLHTTDIDLSAADLATGTLLVEPTVTPASWLWYQYHVSSALRHTAGRRVDERSGRTIGSVLDAEHARGIAVISVEGIEAFLRTMPDNLENLQEITF